MSLESEARPRQLVLLCDGTNNNLTGGHKDTNVVKLCSLLSANEDPDRLVYYDPGVGNPGEIPGVTNWDEFRRRLNRLNGLAFGRGVYENMAESYLFLMKHFRPGDQLYILGFSRGAFTARSVAGLINQFGILQPHMESMVPTLLHVYFGDRGKTDESPERIAEPTSKKKKTSFDAVSEQISDLFVDASTRQVDIHFVGAWDTVASVGLPPFDVRFTALPKPEGKHFVHVRQALALDEHRSQFKPRLYAHDNGSFQTVTGREGSIVQLWFPGAHCDVGGGYERSAALGSDIAFAWLVSEAVTCGLRLSGNNWLTLDERDVLLRLAEGYAESPSDRGDTVHCELRGTALWALTGMTVRDTNRVLMDDGTTFPLEAVAHTSIKARDLSVAKNSVWSKAPTPRYVWYALVLMISVLIFHGQLLMGHQHTGSLWGNAVGAFHEVPDYLLKGLEFQRWQLVGWIRQDLLALVSQDPWRLASWVNTTQADYLNLFESPRWALLWDFVLIGCYASVLSWFAARAFSQIAGLRQVGDDPRPWLNRFGWALPLAVGSDVGENLFTWLVLAAGENGIVSLALPLHVVTAGLSTAKFIGLAGVALLIGAGAVKPRGGSVQRGGGKHELGTPQ